MQSRRREIAISVAAHLVKPACSVRVSGVERFWRAARSSSSDGCTRHRLTFAARPR